MPTKASDGGNMINQWSMNLGQFKDPVSYMCVAGAMVTSSSLAQEMAGSNPFTVMTNISVTEFSKFKEIISGKLK